MKVTPKASRNAVQGWLGDALKVCVTAAPERGRANEAVVALLADALGIAQSKVRVAAGHTASRKIVEIAGIGAEELRRRLG